MLATRVEHDNYLRSPDGILETWEEEFTAALWAEPRLIGWRCPLRWILTPNNGGPIKGEPGKRWRGDIWGIDQQGEMIILEVKRHSNSRSPGPPENFAKAKYDPWSNARSFGGSRMRIDDLEWTPDRVEHVARHSITPEEVEEIFTSAAVFRRGRGGVYEAWGQSDAGRYLLVIFRYLGHNRAWPTTARDMDNNEKRLFRRK